MFLAKTFKYTTPVLSVAPSHLEDTDLLASQSFHLLCDLSTLQQHVHNLLRLRSPLKIQRPLIIWEPSPPSCTSDSLSSCLAAIKEVDVFSPNHLELPSLFDISHNPFSRAKLEDITTQYINSSISPAGEGITAIRAGVHGCLLMVRGQKALYIPPYYHARGPVDAQKNILDTTGAGNAFLGGLAVGYFGMNSWFEACYYGTVAASFMLEQIGIPTLEKDSGVEYWNGENVRATGRFSVIIRC